MGDARGVCFNELVSICALSRLKETSRLPPRLGWACLCAAEWAIGPGGAPRTGRSFIYAAARITGLSSYMAVARAVAAGERADEEGG